MNNEPNSIFDAKTIVALIMVGVFWIGWQMYMEKKYGTTAPPATTENVSQEVPVRNEIPPSLEAASTTSVPAATAAAANEAAAEKSESFTSDFVDLKVSNLGLAVKNVVLKTYSSRSGEPIQMGEGNEPIFEIRERATSLPVPFTVKTVGDGEYEAMYNRAGMKISAQLKINPGKFSLDYSVNVKNPPADFQGLAVRAVEHVHHEGGGNFLMPSYEFTESLIVHDGGSKQRDRVVPDEQLEKSLTNATLLGLGSHYFTVAALDLSDVLPQARVQTHGSAVSGQLDYPYTRGSAGQNILIKGYFGPKSLDLITSVDERLTPLINFGPMSWLARPILWLMKWLNSVFGNWGIAIILLTIIVRLLVLPFNVMSFKSMKAMQAIQPHIKALRERYKDDPQQLNLQMMTLMKSNKVNPLGGCLPMLLQLPVFFALYQVLGQSIELYQAPFALWIQDLSAKDPYYVLPILMGISMFLQQKLTPSTLDPAQAKVMMIMPVVFSLLMFTLPSGLTLYIFVSTLFGIFQQFALMRDRQVQGSPLKA